MLLILFLYGIVIGSFLNVVILRVPKKESFTFDRSHCTSCGYQLRWFDLIPVLSYIGLRGSCRKCKEHISLQYPIIELLNGAAYVGIYYWMGLQWMTLISCLTFSILLVVFMIDYRHFIIPNGTVILLFLLGLVTTLLEGNYWNHIIGFFVVSGLLLIVSIIVPRGMGLGDVKLMAAAGLLLGWQRVILALMVGSIAGSLIGISLIVFKLKSRKDPIPFGPFLSIGIMVALLFGDLIINWYLVAIGVL